MENVLFKYSDFFQDDGGMQKVKQDFTKLGDELIAQAKQYKKEINAVFNFEDVEGFTKLEKKIEDLTKVNEEFSKAKQELLQIEEDYLKALKESGKKTEKLTESTEDLLDAVKNETTARKDNRKALVESTKTLDKLYIELEQHKFALKEVNRLEKEGKVSIEEATVARGRGKLMMKQVTDEIRKQEKAILDSNRVSKEEQKLLDAKIKLEQTEIKTLQEVRDRISALRIVVQSLDYKAEAEKIKAYNREIDELTDILGDNSDTFIQNKINVGNYEESIKNALKESNLFKTGISQLDVAITGLTDVLSKSRAEVEEMEQALGENANAVQRFTIAFGKMNKVLKASVIGLVLVALGALSSLFGDTRAGAVNMEKAMLTLSTTITTFGRVSLTIVKSLGSALIELVSGNFGKAKDEMVNGFDEIKDAFKDSAEAIILGFEYINRAINIEDQVRRLNRELEITNRKMQVNQARADDATRSLLTQLYYNKLVRQQQIAIGAQQKDIAILELEAINNRIKQQAVAQGLAGKELDINKQGYAFAEATQKLAQQKGIDLKLSNELIEEQAQAMLNILKIDTEIALQREDNIKQLRQINQDLFEQNLDLLIDIIDTEKNISEAFVNNTKKNFEARLNEFNRFIVRFRENAQLQIEEFNDLFAKQAKILGEKAPKLSLKFDDENNVKVFLNGVELSLDQSLGTIKDLNKQLQKAGIAEIPINRFREFLVEARNGKRDFDALAISVREYAFALKELEGQLQIENFKSQELLDIETRLKELSTIKFRFFQQKERIAVEKEIEKLEKRREQLAKDTDKRIMENRISTIQAMLDSTYTVTENGVKKEKLLYEKGSEERTALEKELLELKIGIREKDYDDLKQKTDEQIQKEKGAYEKFTAEVRRITSLVVDKIIEINQKRVQLNEQLVDKQKDAVERQEERAQQGLTNTLAFEEEQLAKREAQLIKSQKKQERLDKIKALWTSYASYADKEKDPNQALFKALKDFAVLEAISASFGDGGIVGVDGYEKVRTNSNGITIGRSHSMNGGIPALFEGGEGFFSKDEVSNIGQSNFRALKEMAGNGTLDNNFFSKQKDELVSYLIPAKSSSTDKALLSEIREVKKAIISQPRESWDFAENNEKLLDYIQTIIEGNKTTKNHFKSKKRRF